MTTLCSDVLKALTGKTLATAESCTGGAIGAAITGVSGSSAVYKGGIVSYCNEIKHKLLSVDQQLLDTFGAVSSQVAEAMAIGVRNALNVDVSVSVTGLAGPGSDGSSYPVGTVFIGYADANVCFSKQFYFHGDREFVRISAVKAALTMILENAT